MNSIKEVNLEDPSLRKGLSTLSPYFNTHQCVTKHIIMCVVSVHIIQHQITSTCYVHTGMLTKAKLNAQADKCDTN